MAGAPQGGRLVPQVDRLSQILGRPSDTQSVELSRKSQKHLAAIGLASPMGFHCALIHRIAFGPCELDNLRDRTGSVASGAQEDIAASGPQ